MIKQLQKQIAGLEAELEKAYKQREAALTGDARAFAQAQSAVAVLEEAIEELRERVARAEAEAEEAQKAKDRAATIARLVQTSKEAAAARDEFEQAYREASEALETYAARLAEASRRWRASGQDFFHTLQTIAPGITTAATNRAAPERYGALVAERDVVLQALKEAGADLEAALNDYVTSTRYATQVHDYTPPEVPLEEVLAILIRLGHRFTQSQEAA